MKFLEFRVGWALPTLHGYAALGSHAETLQYNVSAVIFSYNPTRIGLTNALFNIGNAAMASRNLASQLRLSCNI